MKVIEALKPIAPNPKAEINHQYLLLRSAIDILLNDSKQASQGSPDFKLRPPAEICHLLSDLWKSGNEKHQETEQQFVIQFADSE